MERAHPQAVRSAARRAWQVTIGPDARRLACTAPNCPAATGVDIVGRSAQQAALGHLAAHAQHEPLDEHLRTCRCHAHGCTWHPRHRGCTGPIQLTVFRQRRGRAWHLADTCTGCAHLIPYAAAVPDPSPATGPRRCARPSARDQDEPAAASAVHTVVPALLRYLAAALGPRVPAGAEILALYCLLRADTRGTAHLPAGLLRALRLDHHRDQLVASLTAGRWLAAQDQPPGTPPQRHPGVLTVQIADPAAVGALVGLSRRQRRSLSDATMRLLAQPHLRVPEDGPRLAALRQSGVPPRTREPARTQQHPVEHPRPPGSPARAGSEPGAGELTPSDHAPQALLLPPSHGGTAGPCRRETHPTRVREVR